MIYVRVGGFFLALLFICSSCIPLGAAAGQRQQMPQPQRASQRAARGERIRPPDKVQCPWNNLTLYGGRVLSLYRDTGRTVIRIRTDWDTTEQAILHHPNSDDPSQWFLLDGAGFKPSDWVLIEAAKNRLRPRMRANMWVCDDGRNPVVDWQPPSAARQ
jgi:hypothetical protein